MSDPFIYHTCDKNMMVGIHQVFLSPLRFVKTVPKPSPALIKQINASGQLEPVITRRKASGRYEILKNAVTWIAIQRAGLHQVEIAVREDISDDDAIEILNAPYSSDPIAEAQWFQSLLEGQGASQNISQLARSLDLSRSYVAHSLQFLSLDTELQQAIQIGRLKPGHAKVLVSIKNSSARTLLAAKIIQKKLSVRDTEQFSRKLKTKETNPSLKSVETKQLEMKLSEDVGSPVEIDEKEGKLIIDYRKNLDVLEGILLRLRGSSQ